MERIFCIEPRPGESGIIEFPSMECVYLYFEELVGEKVAYETTRRLKESRIGEKVTVGKRLPDGKSFMYDVWMEER